MFDDVAGEGGDFLPRLTETSDADRFVVGRVEVAPGIWALLVSDTPNIPDRGVLDRTAFDRLIDQTFEGTLPEDQPDPEPYEYDPAFVPDQDTRGPFVEREDAEAWLDGTGLRRLTTRIVYDGDWFYIQLGQS